MEKSVLNLIGRVLFAQSDRIQSEKEEGEKIIQARKIIKIRRRVRKKAIKQQKKLKETAQVTHWC